MVSVQEYIKCPKCKCEDSEEKCFEDIDYNAHEYNIYCKNCGYSKIITPKRDENDKPVKDKDGKYIWETKEKKGAGVVFIGDGIRALYTIPADEKERADFLIEFEQWTKENPKEKVEIRLYRKK
jgi:hypothetical protein